MSSETIPGWAMEASMRITLIPNKGHPANVRAALALTEAEKRGLKRAAPLLERLREWIEEEVGAELPFTEAQQAEFDAIRSLGEQQ